MRLLIVEDDRFQQEIICSLFAQQAAKSVIVDVASTLAAAKQQCEAADFLAVELTLPDAEPLDVLAWVSESTKPALIVSGSFDEATVRACALPNVFGFLAKGNPAEQIVAAITFALERLNIWAEHYQSRREACRLLAERFKERCHTQGNQREMIRLQERTVDLLQKGMGDVEPTEATK